MSAQQSEGTTTTRGEPSLRPCRANCDDEMRVSERPAQRDGNDVVTKATQTQSELTYCQFSTLRRDSGVGVVRAPRK